MASARTSSSLLIGKVALVTGGGSGIGRAVCQTFAKAGANLAVVDISKTDLQETTKLLEGEGQYHGFTTDVSSATGVRELFEGIKKALPAPPTIAVNCAGITKDQFLLQMDEQSFDDVLRVNLKGTFLVTQGLARIIADNNLTGGSIVNISSIVGKVGNMGQCNYAASKAGVIGFTKTAAKELAKLGIRCNAVVPGFIDTPMVETLPEKVTEAIRAQTPLRRTGQPEEVAEACLFLASSRSSYITGTTLEVTGGLFL